MSTASWQEGEWIGALDLANDVNSGKSDGLGRIPRIGSKAITFLRCRLIRLRQRRIHAHEFDKLRTRRRSLQSLPSHASADRDVRAEQPVKTGELVIHRAVRWIYRIRAQRAGRGHRESTRALVGSRPEHNPADRQFYLPCPHRRREHHDAVLRRRVEPQPVQIAEGCALRLHRQTSECNQGGQHAQRNSDHELLSSPGPPCRSQSKNSTTDLTAFLLRLGGMHETPARLRESPPESCKASLISPS